jgi:hypothetical protein
MAFKQLKNLIEWVVEYHEALEHQYTHLAASQPDERMRMALEFLASREAHQAEAMEDYLQDADDDLMDMWLRDPPAFESSKIQAGVPACEGCHDVQDVLKNILQAHENLSQMYELRARLARTSRESELFSGLLNSQQAEARLQSRDIARLEIY